MRTDRLAASSDGAVAIHPTAVVLDLHAPESTDLAAWRPEPGVLGSCVHPGTCRDDDPHPLQLVERTSGAIRWADPHLASWPSLVSVATARVEEHHVAALPAALRGVVLLCAALGRQLLQVVVIRDQGPPRRWRPRWVATSRGAVARPARPRRRPVAGRARGAVCVVVALVRLVPGQRIERRLRAIAPAR